MTDLPEKQVLAEQSNQIATPVYFDRQIILADDLNLDRAARNAELMRMRRLLHGWGVVAGLIPAVRERDLIISPGYGVTRTGAEVYLPEQMTIPNILARLWACCGAEDDPCAISPEKTAVPGKAGPETEGITGWLIARPHVKKSAPRAGLPEGCDHPANSSSWSRDCHNISIELWCDLPESLIPKPADCKTITSLLCQQPMPMLPMPVFSAEDDFLILGRIRDTGRSPVFDPAGRRALLPMSLLQDWLLSCGCQNRDAKDEPGKTDDSPIKDDVREPPVLQIGRDQYVPAAPAVLEEAMTQTLDIFRKPSSSEDTPGKPLLTADRSARLRQGGLVTVGDFLNSDTRTVAQIAGISVEDADKLMADVAIAAGYKKIARV